jgi:hypothetical protein
MESWMSVLNRQFCAETKENPIPVRAYTGEQLTYAMGVAQRYAAAGTISRQTPTFWNKFIQDLSSLASTTSYIYAPDEARNIQGQTGQQTTSEEGTVTMMLYAVLEDLPSLNCFDVWTRGSTYRKQVVQQYKGEPVKEPSKEYKGVQEPYQGTQTAYQAAYQGTNQPGYQGGAGQPGYDNKPAAGGTGSSY